MIRLVKYCLFRLREIFQNNFFNTALLIDFLKIAIQITIQKYNFYLSIQKVIGLFNKSSQI